MYTYVFEILAYTLIIIIDSVFKIIISFITRVFYSYYGFLIFWYRAKRMFCPTDPLPYQEVR